MKKSPRESNKNVVTSPKDLENRYCNHCHTMLVHDEIHNIFKCQTCGCSSVLSQTQPSVSIRTNFPTYSANEPNQIRTSYLVPTTSFRRTRKRETKLRTLTRILRSLGHAKICILPQRNTTHMPMTITYTINSIF